MKVRLRWPTLQAPRVLAHALAGEEEPHRSQGSSLPYGVGLGVGVGVSTATQPLYGLFPHDCP